MDSSMISKIEKGDALCSGARPHQLQPIQGQFHRRPRLAHGHIIATASGPATVGSLAHARLQPRDDTRTRFDGDGNTGPGPADAGLVPGQLNTTISATPLGVAFFVVAGKLAPAICKTPPSMIIIVVV